MSSLSGSGTSALLDVIIATFKCQKSEKKGEVYSLASPFGTDPKKRKKKRFEQTAKKGGERREGEGDY